MKQNKQKNVIKIELGDNSSARVLFGVHDENLKTMERILGIKVSARGKSLILEGNSINTEKARVVILQLYDMAKSGHNVYPQDIEQAANMIKERRDRVADLRRCEA